MLQGEVRLEGGGVTGRREGGRCGNEMGKGLGKVEKIDGDVYLVLARGEPEGQVLVTELGLEEGAKVVEGVLTASLVDKDLVEGGAVHERVVIVVVVF